MYFLSKSPSESCFWLRFMQNSAALVACKWGENGPLNKKKKSKQTAGRDAPFSSVQIAKRTLSTGDY